MRVVGILPLKHNNYDGYFLAVEGGRLPDPGCDKWVVGGGMYPADLRAEFHVYRELWQVHHTMVRPSVREGGGRPAVGVFLHKGKEYPVILNGKEQTMKV